MKFNTENFLTTIRGYKLSDLYQMEDQFDDLLDKCQSVAQCNLVETKIALVKQVIQEKCTFAATGT